MPNVQDDWAVPRPYCSKKIALVKPSTTRPSPVRDNPSSSRWECPFQSSSFFKRGSWIISWCLVRFILSIPFCINWAKSEPWRAFSYLGHIIRCCQSVSPHRCHWSHTCLHLRRIWFGKSIGRWMRNASWGWFSFSTAKCKCRKWNNMWRRKLLQLFFTADPSDWHSTAKLSSFVSQLKSQDSSMFERHHRCFLDGCFTLSTEKQWVWREEDILLSQSHKRLYHTDSWRLGRGFC